MLWDNIGASGGLSSFSFQITLVSYLEPRFERPGLSLTLYLSAGTELGGRPGVDQLVTTRPATALWQVPARRSAWRRVGALTLDMRVMSAQKKGPGLLKDGAL